MNEQHPTIEQKQSGGYQDLFTAATIIDYEVASCKSEESLMHRLATSDTLEIQLRKLGAFIYLRRTKDKTGANRMLGIRAPGTNTDIAPKWMVDDANTFSKLSSNAKNVDTRLSAMMVQAVGPHQLLLMVVVELPNSEEEAMARKEVEGGEMGPRDPKPKDD